MILSLKLTSLITSLTIIVLIRINLNFFKGYLNLLKGYLASSIDMIIKFNIILLVRSYRIVSIAINTFY